MKILIIGGSGLIGYNLFQDLKNHFDEIECTYLKNKITQSSSHKINDNVFFSEILDGPAKGTIVEVKFLAEDLKTKIIVDVELKLSLKAKVFSPIIKKAYKQFLTGIFYKMNTRAIQIE